MDPKDLPNTSDTIGGNDPQRERARFLEEHRLMAAMEDVAPMCAALDPQAMEARDILCGFASQVGVFSLGNHHEAHGPALAQDIDDRTATATAVALANATGARYLGHVPLCTDRIGELAKAWSPAYSPPADFLDGLIRFVDHTLSWTHDRNGLARPRLIHFVSGHGGNNVLNHHLGKVALALGVDRCIYDLSIQPFESIDTQHAGSMEHCLAAHLGPGCIDTGRMPDISAWSLGQLYRALTQYPAWGGMAGFYLFGDERFNAVRERYQGVKSAVAKLLEGRALHADPEAGARIFNNTTSLLKHRILREAKELGIDTPKHIPTVPTPRTQHRSALFTLTDPQGRVLLQHRTDDAPVLPGHWGFFGGGVEAGESIREALRREAREELGLDLPPMRSLGLKRRSNRQGELVEGHFFVGQLNTPVDALRHSQSEGQDLGLFTPQELQTLRIAPRDWAWHAMIFADLRRSA